MKSLFKSMLVIALATGLSATFVHAEPAKTPEKQASKPKAAAKAPASTTQTAPESYWIGVRVVPIPEILLPQFGVKEDGPGRVVVEQVIEDGPAAKAGLKRGDVLVKFAEADIYSLRDLVDAIEKIKGTAQPLIVVREGKSENLSVTPGIRPAEPVVVGEEIEIDELPGINITPEFPTNFRNPQRTMRQMENMFRQMQGGVDGEQTVIDEDTVTETDNPVQGNATRLEVRSHKGEDGKTSINVTKTVTTNGKTEKKSWIVESLEKLPAEIYKEVKSLFGG